MSNRQLAAAMHYYGGNSEGCGRLGFSHRQSNIRQAAQTRVLNAADRNDPTFAKRSNVRTRAEITIPRSDVAHYGAAVLNGTDRKLSHGAPPWRMTPNGCLGNPAIVSLPS
jgi:hypothetical protein